MPAKWEVIRKVWDMDDCSIDCTFQNAGLSEQNAAAVASELSDLEEIAPTYDDARVTYTPRRMREFSHST